MDFFWRWSEKRKGITQYCLAIFGLMPLPGVIYIVLADPSSGNFNPKFGIFLLFYWLAVQSSYRRYQLKCKLNKLIDKMMDENTNLEEIAEEKALKQSEERYLHKQGIDRLSWFGIRSLPKKLEKYHID